MQQVLVDMDGVLADVYTHLIAYEFKESGMKLSQQNMHGLLEECAFPSFDKIIRSKGFFRTAPVIEHSIEGLNYLNNKYKVLIVSSATEFPGSLTEKYAWLNEFFPFISWQQMIFCGSKDSVCGDIMIDDHIKNLNSFRGRKIMFTQPHNIFIQDVSLERVNNWTQIMSML
jgi:5'(3')-deoxyribonucleotidase